VEPVTAEFEIRLSDMLRAQTWWLLRKWYMSAAYVLVLATVVYMVPAMANRGFELADVRGFVIPFLLLVVVPGSIYWSSRSTIRSLQPKQRQHRYEFTDHDLQIDTGLSKSTVDWGAVQRVVETRGAFYLFLHKSIFHVVPKRGLRSKLDLDRLRAMVEVKIGSRAKLRRDTSGLEP
jgi:YcxB-like protein